MQKEQKNLFLEDSYLTRISTKIVSIRDDSNPDYMQILLEQNIYHPQGGGQPNDDGFISLDDQKIQIQGGVMDRELNQVWIQIPKSDLTEGTSINMEINEEKRKLFAQIHSGGHLIDMVVNELKLEWAAGKGYHFPDSPYVEYVGPYDAKTQSNLLDQFNELAKKILDKNSQIPTISKVYNYDQAKSQFILPSYLPENKDVRWVQMNSEDPGCPCGGTHVKSLGDIKLYLIQNNRNLEVTSIKKKGKNVRVSYLIKNN